MPPDRQNLKELSLLQVNVPKPFGAGGVANMEQFDLMMALGAATSNLPKLPCGLAKRTTAATLEIFRNYASGAEQGSAQEKLAQALLRTENPLPEEILFPVTNGTPLIDAPLPGMIRFQGEVTNSDWEQWCETNSASCAHYNPSVHVKPKAGELLTLLGYAERQLPTILTRPGLWEATHFAGMNPPLERLHCKFSDFTIAIHFANAIAGSAGDMHSHPWPFAVRMLAGSYVQPLRQVSTGIMGRCYIRAGDRYEIITPDIEHAVEPQSGRSITLVVTGSSWKDCLRPSHKEHGFYENNVPSTRRLSLLQEIQQLLA